MNEKNKLKIIKWFGKPVATLKVQSLKDAV